MVDETTIAGLTITVNDVKISKQKPFNLGFPETIDLQVKVFRGPDLYDYEGFFF